MRLVLLLFTCATFSNGYKVLLIGTFNGKSHFLYIQAFANALLNRGHQVTLITSQSMNQTNLTNYTEVLIDPPFDIHSMCMLLITLYITMIKIYFFFLKVPQEMLLTLGDTSLFQFIPDMSRITNAMNAYAFENSNVQKLIHSTDQHFDIVINEEFFADSFLMFAHKFKAPIITICKSGTCDDLKKIEILQIRCIFSKVRLASQTQSINKWV